MITLYRVRLLGVAAAVSLFVTACGGTSAPSAKVASLGAEGSTTPSTTTPVNTQDALLKFAKCMRDNGVDMKDPTFDAQGNPTGGGFGGPRTTTADGKSAGPDRESPEFQTAQTVCRPLLAGVAFGGRGGNRPDRAAIQAGLNEFTKCLRTEGLQVDDITFGRGRNGQGGQGGQAQGAPPDGGPDGPPPVPADGATPGATPSATTPDGPGFRNGPDGGPDRGPRRDGQGFDPTSRIIERLNLDSTDPNVKAAIDKCQPVLVKAFTPPSTTVAAK